MTPRGSASSPCSMCFRPEDPVGAFLALPAYTSDVLLLRMAKSFGRLGTLHVLITGHGMMSGEAKVLASRQHEDSHRCTALDSARFTFTLRMGGVAL